MYQLNPLQQNVLITNAEVIFHAPTKHTLDPRTVQNAIIIAEERFIRPTIGDALYDALATEKNTLVDATNKVTLQEKFTAVTLNDGDIVNAYEFLSAANLRLWKQGNLWKLCAEAVMIMCLPDEFVQLRSEGVVHGAPPASPLGGNGVVTPELRSVKWVMDKKLMDRIDPLIEAVKNFICKNKADYPLYTTCPCDDEETLSQRRKTNWVLGLYDDE